MQDSNTDMLAQSLVRLLGHLVTLQGELATLMRKKIEAVKRADTDEIQAITTRELEVAEQLTERNGLRHQLTRRLLAGLGLPPDDRKRMRLTDLAEHFPEPRRSQLLVVASGLKERVNEIERLRVTSTLITQEMLKHMQEVFSVMTSGPAAGEGYSRSGERHQTASPRVFEAVG